MVRQRDESAAGRGRHGLRALAEAVAPLAQPILKRRGAALATLVRAWPEIVGDRLAGVLEPDRLVFARGAQAQGTLHVRLGIGALATEVLHAAPMIIERINAALGFGAVARLRLVHAPIEAAAAPPPPPRPLAAAEEARLSDHLAAVADPELRAILERLGRAALAATAAPAPAGEAAAAGGGEAPR